jgi:hypothetical protein
VNRDGYYKLVMKKKAYAAIAKAAIVSNSHLGTGRAVASLGW